MEDLLCSQLQIRSIKCVFLCYKNLNKISKICVVPIHLKYCSKGEEEGAAPPSPQ